MVKLQQIIISLTLALLYSITPLWAGKNQSISVVLVLDISGSMKENDPQKISWEAARLFIDLLSPGDEIAILMYSSGIKKRTPLVTISKNQKEDKETLKNILRGDYGGGTQTLSTMEEAVKVLKNSTASHDNRTYAILLLTDGIDDLFGSHSVEEVRKRYDQFRLKARNEEIRIFPIGMGKDFFDHSKSTLASSLQNLSDEQMLSIQNVDELPKTFAYIYGQIYDSIVRPLAIFESGYSFDMHELSVESVMIAAGKFDKSIMPTYRQPDKSEINLKNLPPTDYLATGNSYRILKLGNPQAGQYTLTMSQAPKTALVVQIPDLILRAEFADFNPKEKAIVVRSAAVYTEQGTKIYSNQSFYQESQIKLVVLSGNQTTKSIPLQDNGTQGDSKAGDFIYAGQHLLNGFGQFTYYVELEHPLFRRRSQTYTLAFDEKIHLFVPQYESDTIVIKQGEVLGIPIAARAGSNLGKRDEFFKVSLTKGSGEGWEKINLQDRAVILSEEKTESSIAIETDMGRIWDFGLSAIPPGKYDGGLVTIEYVSGDKAQIPLAFLVERNEKLFFYGLLFWGSLGFFLWLVIGTWFIKKFPRHFYAYDLRRGGSAILARRSIHSTILPFGTSKYKLGSLGTLIALDNSRKNVYLQYVSDDQIQREKISTRGHEDTRVMNNTNGFLLSTKSFNRKYAEYASQYLREYNHYASRDKQIKIIRG